MAFVLAPEPPCFEWLGELDQWLRGSAGFFAHRPVVLDLGGVALSSHAVGHLIAEFQQRGIRVMGIENADSCELGPDLPPVLRGSRSAGGDPAAADAGANDKATSAAGAHNGRAPLLVDSPIRSGQCVFHPDGDVTVLGSIASGAELVAGGSIHVYGTLRGRAMAGSNGNRGARIFCSKIQAELLAIDGYYLTADSMDPALINRPAQAWLDGESVMIANLE
jgi:septum site-determining protein MinC